MNELDYSKFNWVPSSKERREATIKEPTGIGAKPADEQEPMDKGFYESMYDAIVTYFDNAEDADRVLTAKEIDKDRVKGEVLREFDALDSLLSEDRETPSLDYFDEIDVDTREEMTDAQAKNLREVAKTEFGQPLGGQLKDVTDTEEGKLTNVGPLEELAEDIDPGTIDTEPLDADGVQPTDGKGLMSPSEEGGMFKLAEAEAEEIAIDNIGITAEMWNAYKKEVSTIESGGEKAPYQVAGGANDHYDGKYQLGKMAKADAGQLLGIDLKHNKSARQSFRNNPALQEKAFAAYTAKNHSYLMAKSDKYRELSKEQQIAVLGYAHNQGWSEAKKWLNTGAEGKDAFGTKGSKYYKAITKNLGVPAELTFSRPSTSPRPMLRPEEEDV
jgi:hypothetical protein